MATKTERASTYTAGSGDQDSRNGGEKSNLWTSMLESVSSGKRLPEKNLLIMGMIMIAHLCIWLLTVKQADRQKGNGSF